MKGRHGSIPGRFVEAQPIALATARHEAGHTKSTTVQAQAGVNRPQGVATVSDLHKQAWAGCHIPPYQILAVGETML